MKRSDTAFAFSPYAIIGMMGFGLLAFLWHLSVGVKVIPLTTVAEALLLFDETNFDHIVVRELRLFRAIFAVLTGAALAVAGALMQGVTRNPLADPGILGVLSGASFAVVVVIGFLGWVSPSFIPLVAAIGATVTAVMVWGIANSAAGGATPLVLVLSGAVIAAFLGALITMVHLISEDSFQNLRVWLSGTLAVRNADVLVWVMPWLLVGFGLAFGIARQITAVSLGDETAIGLGVNVLTIQKLALLAVIALTAGAVALAGPLGFVGLVIPHVVRLFVRSDYQLIVPCSAVCGAIYLLLIDSFSRILFAPLEISTGIMTAALGAPVFIWLIRAKL